MEAISIRSFRADVGRIMVMYYTAIIPVAGWGTRSLPASKVIPKEMMPVFDRPIIQHIVEEARASGMDKVVLVTSKGKSAIEDHFDRHLELELVLERSQKTDLLRALIDLSDLIQIQSVRQKEQRGLGHAISMGADLVSGSHFGVFLGDEMMVSDPPAMKLLIDFCRQQEGDAGAVLLMEVPASDVSKYGICELKGNQVTRCVEKPKQNEIASRLALVGRYFLPKDAMEFLKTQKPGANGEIQLTDTLQKLAEQGRLYGLVFDGLRFDAGDRLGFLKANLHHYLQSQYRDEVEKMIGEFLK